MPFDEEDSDRVETDHIIHECTEEIKRLKIENERLTARVSMLEKECYHFKGFVDKKEK